MPKVIKPQENVEYTFRFSADKKETYRWFGEISDTGRILLYNVKTNYCSDVTQARFSYMMRKLLVFSRPVQPKAPATAEPVRRLAEQAPTVSKPSPPSEDEQDKIKALDGEVRDWVLELIQELKNTTAEERRALSFRYPYKKEYTINGMVSQFEYALEHGISDRAFGVLVCRYMAMSDVMQK